MKTTTFLLLSLVLLGTVLLVSCAMPAFDAEPPVARQGPLATPTAAAPPRQSFNNVVAPALGTIGNEPLRLYVNDRTALLISPTISSPNIIAGWWENVVTSTVGATIHGGGTDSDVNAVSGNYGVVGGGHGNVAGIDAAVAGGAVNIASGEGSFASGANNEASGIFSQAHGKQNTASGEYSTIDGGLNNAADDYAVVGGGAGNNAGGPSTTIAGGYANTALGEYATVGGGHGNVITASLDYPEEAMANTIGGGAYNQVGSSAADYVTIGGGSHNVISAPVQYATVPGGYGASATHDGELAYASGFFTVTGDAQIMTLLPKWESTDGVAHEMFLEGAVPARMTIPADTTWLFDVRVVARRTNADNESASYWYRGAIDNNAGTVALVGSVSSVLVIEDTAAWAVSITADNTNKALKITVTGEAGKTIQWVGEVRIVQTTG